MHGILYCRLLPEMSISVLHVRPEHSEALFQAYFRPSHLVSPTPIFACNDVTSSWASKYIQSREITGGRRDTAASPQMSGTFATTFDGDFCSTRSGARMPCQHGSLPYAFGVFVNMVVGVEEFFQSEDRPRRDGCPQADDNDGVGGAINP